ncbi:hypothetical protein [Bacillus sp. FJAT-27245]|uniref:hypothetical protein n=1 Tax=Bacillus sp. FJAT-27245 TaxID=1684144 RepID=UPI0006A7A864|nr:hypothetical protein [Bacillus sp. FJAT-27245]
MRKMIYFLLVLMLFGLAACSSNEETSKASEKQDKQTEKKTEEKSVEVDKGLLNVEITLPASMFEGEDIDKVIADAKKEGISKATKNADGSVTYKMSKAKHKEMMAEIAKSISESVNEMTTSGDFVSFKEITHNDSFKEFTVTVDKAAYDNSMDGFGLFGLGMSGMIYQLYNGENEENTKVTINTKDEATGEIFETIVYPDDMDDTQSE